MGSEENLAELWAGRYDSIRDHEAHLARNGTRVLKFFLNLSKEEQRRRFVARIDEQEKNWKFNEGDLKERGFWGDYQGAYEMTYPEVSASQREEMQVYRAQLMAEET